GTARVGARGLGCDLVRRRVDHRSDLGGVAFGRTDAGARLLLRLQPLRGELLLALRVVRLPTAKLRPGLGLETTRGVDPGQTELPGLAPVFGRGRRSGGGAPES